MTQSPTDKAFLKIGTRLVQKTRTQSRFARGWSRTPGTPFRLDIKTDAKREYFELVHDDTPMTVIVRDIDPKDRHLLLQVAAGGDNQLFLCGHDERHYFAAGVEKSVKNVADAKTSLMPPEVQRAVHDAQLNSRERFTRHNPAYKRQGEWFFVLVPGLEVNKLHILYNEPLRRGRSKPHFAAELMRQGGEDVMVNNRFAPNGLPIADYNNLAEDIRKRPGWSRMRRNAEVYVRGTISHPDHATLTLKQWHRVYMNREVALRPEMLAFLD